MKYEVNVMEGKGDPRTGAKGKDEAHRESERYTVAMYGALSHQKGGRREGSCGEGRGEIAEGGSRGNPFFGAAQKLGLMNKEKGRGSA